MSKYAYVVNSQRPTAVSQSLVCNFTGIGEQNLILAKGNYLEVYTTVRQELKDADVDAPLSVETELALQLLMEQPLNGTIHCMSCYCPTIGAQAHLFILTERKSFCVLSYDAALGKIITKAVGSVKDRAAREIEMGVRSCIDPDNRMIAMLLYEGQLKVIPIYGEAGLQNVIDLPVFETRIIDFKFLPNCSRPTICFLYEDNRRMKHVKTMVVDANDRELLPGPWTHSNVDFSASLLIPIPNPLGGVVVVASNSITYLGKLPSTGGQSSEGSSSSSFVTSIEIPTMMCSAYAPLTSESNRILFADHRGQLHALILCTDRDNQICALAVDYVGRTSIANTLSYLGEGYVFLGSMYGDSQFIKLLPEKDNNGSNVLELSNFPNIGPIVDMCLADSGASSNNSGGQHRQLVTCSGAYGDGSLRIIRSGIGVHEQAAVEVPGIKRMWSLRNASNACFDKHLVQSFIGETRVLSIENEELAEIEILGFSSEEATLFCGNMIGDTIVQVTPSSVRLVHAHTYNLLDEYKASQVITVANGTATQICIALTGAQLICIEVDGVSKKLEVKSSGTVDQEVACLSIQTFSATESSSMMDIDEGAAEMSSKDSTSGMMAVGTWSDKAVRLLTWPSLQELCRVALGTDTQARNILLVELGVTVLLLIGLGDGRLVTYNVEQNESDVPQLVNKRSGVLGTHPISFSTFVNNGKLCVFAACDRPTVIYSRNGKIGFSVLDIKQVEVTNMAPFHSELFPDCLALSSETMLMIGVIEDVQKVHIQKIHLGEAPRRIAYAPHSGCYAVVTDKIVQGGVGEETLSRILFFEDGSMEQFGMFELDKLETAMSCKVCYFPRENCRQADSQPSSTGKEHEFVVVGTAQILNHELEPTHGRILIFEITADYQVNLLIEKDVSGAVFAIANPLGLLAVSVNSNVMLYKFVIENQSAVRSSSSSTEQLPAGYTPQYDLHLDCINPGHIMALYLEAKNDTLLVGDLVRSLTLLRCSSQSIARGSNNESVSSAPVRSANSDTDFEKKFELKEMAHDFNSNYMRAVAIMAGSTVNDEDDTYFGADTAGNIFAMRYMAKAATEEERSKLESVGEFHIGECLNVFERGNLVGQPIDSDVGSPGAAENLSSSEGASHVVSIDSAASGNHDSIFSSNYFSVTGLKGDSCSMMYGTLSGCIGNIIMLSEDSFQFFNTLQRVMKNALPPLGGLSHTDWRMFRNELRTTPQRNMVDGNFVESLLERPADEVERIVLELNSELNTLIDNTSVSNMIAGSKKSGDTSVSGDGSKTSSTGELLMKLSSEKVKFTAEDVIRRVEDIARLH